MKLTKGKSLVTALLVSAVLTGGMATSFAATQTQTLDMTSMTMPTFTAVQAGDVLTLKISGLRGSEGVYASVCAKTVDSTTKSTLCDTNQADMAWITADGANHSAAGSTGGAITVADTFANIDCKVTACVLYVRGDHNNPTAGQLTRKIDLTFTGGGVSKTNDVVTGTAGSFTLTPNVPHDLTYRTPITFNLTAQSGLAITLSSLTPDCSVVGNVVNALAGDGATCAIAAKTVGNDTYKPLNVNFPFYTHSFVQSASIAWPSATLKTKVAVYFARVKTNTGVYPTLASTTPKICSIGVVGANYRLLAIKDGTCTITVSSPGDLTSAKRWTAITGNRTFVLSSTGKSS